MNTEYVDINLFADNGDGTHTKIEVTKEQAALLESFLEALRVVHPLMLNENCTLVQPTYQRYVEKIITINNKNEC